MIDFHSLSEADQKIHQQKWGSYNDFPPGWKQLTEKEFAQSRLADMYTPELVEHRQMFRSDVLMLADVGKMVEARLFFNHDGTGWAMSIDTWAGTVTYYRFGCKHDMTGKLTKKDREKIGFLGRCQHASKCKKCGYISVVDSSD
jgi:hypothetical protein